MEEAHSIRRGDPMSKVDLFGETEGPDRVRKPPSNPVKAPGPAELLRAARNQVLLMPTDLESLPKMPG